MIKVNEFVSYGWVGNECILYHRFNHKVCKLDSIGTEIFKLCCQNIDLNQLIIYFQDKYPVSNPLTVKQDITTFIQRLEKGGYLYYE